MFSTLSAGSIGVRAGSWQESLVAARLGGFAGVEIDLQAVHNAVLADGLDAVRARFDDAGVVPAAFFVPVDWNGEEKNWRAGLERASGAGKNGGGAGL
jgi:sugar phosphate isomerase/epimerase